MRNIKDAKNIESKLYNYTISVKFDSFGCTAIYKYCSYCAITVTMTSGKKFQRGFVATKYSITIT